ncbi:MAG: hypothetical protein Hyperionvirus5_57 [Hyperionvirus sp.]|uniref:BTB domain-containing protein n=1 Tax=Hyperionvirus sp. TaxID=2487770 RepID=A0A3G5AAM4_9VIRU|nr:MAG: hypothetical protein Hyperionvirus5_57 [Hyperionvirus sp.]
MKIKITNPSTSCETDYDVPKASLEKSKYFAAIFSSEDYNEDVPLIIPSEYPRELLNFIFHKSSKIPEKELFDTFSACLYFDLRYDRFLELMQEVVIRLPLVPSVLELLDIGRVDPGVAIDNCFDRLIARDPEGFKELYKTSELAQREMLWSHLHRNRHICESKLESDILLFDYTTCKPLPILNNFAAAIEKFNQISNDVFAKDFKWDNIIMAGGALLDSIHKETLNPDTDVDIWVYGSKEQRREAIIYVLNHLSSKMDGYYSHKGSVIYFFPIDIRRCFQIINTNNLTKYDVLDYFDYCCCKILYDGKQILCTKNFINSIQTKVIQRNHLQRFVPFRLQKMLSKGFKYSLTEEEKIQYDEYINSPPEIPKPYYPTKLNDAENIKQLCLANNFHNSVTDSIKVLLMEFNFDKTIESYFTGSVINELTFKGARRTTNQIRLEIHRGGCKIKFEIKVTSVNNRFYGRFPDKATWQIPYLMLGPYAREVINNLNLYVGCLNEKDIFGEDVKEYLGKTGKKVSYSVMPIIKTRQAQLDDEGDDSAVEGEVDRYISVKTKNIIIDGVPLDIVGQMGIDNPVLVVREIEWEKKYVITANIVPYLWVNKVGTLYRQTEVGVTLFAEWIKVRSVGDKKIDVGIEE